ncbi:hypothetical protein ACFX2G_019913 [Malus domestica]
MKKGRGCDEWEERTEKKGGEMREHRITQIWLPDPFSSSSPMVFVDFQANQVDQTLGNHFTTSHLPNLLQKSREKGVETVKFARWVRGALEILGGDLPISEAKSDHHHYQWTPCEPRNVS